MKGNFKVKEPIIPYKVKEYRCFRAVGKPSKLDGDLSKPFWSTGEWTDDFHDIEGDSRPRPAKYTRVKVLWDEEALYVAAELKDDTIWATVRNRDELIYIDNDFEVFLAPQDSSHRYYELEMNAANSVWDLLMEKPQRDDVRRIIGWDIQGLESAVRVNGTLNDPSADNRGWTVELKIPWFSLRECGSNECYPMHFAPDVGEVWRMNFSRVEYHVHTENNTYVKDKDPATGADLPEENWVWAPTGVIDIHMPEMWGYLVFTDRGEAHPLPLASDDVKLALRRLYYREHAFLYREERFTDDVHALMGEEADRYGIRLFTTPSMFEAIANCGDEVWHIRQDGYVWRDDTSVG